MESEKINEIFKKIDESEVCLYCGKPKKDGYCEICGELGVCDNCGKILPIGRGDNFFWCDKKENWYCEKCDKELKTTKTINLMPKWVDILRGVKSGAIKMEFSDLEKPCEFADKINDLLEQGKTLTIKKNGNNTILSDNEYKDLDKYNDKVRLDFELTYFHLNLIINSLAKNNYADENTLMKKLKEVRGAFK